MRLKCFQSNLVCLARLCLNSPLETLDFYGLNSLKLILIPTTGSRAWLLLWIFFELKVRPTQPRIAEKSRLAQHFIDSTDKITLGPKHGRPSWKPALRGWAYGLSSTQERTPISEINKIWKWRRKDGRRSRAWAISKYKTCEGKAYGKLILGISEKLVPYIEDASTASSVWKRLEELYAPTKYVPAGHEGIEA